MTARISRLVRCLSLALVVLSATAGAARAMPDGGVSPPEVVAALRAAGYPADLAANRAGDPVIHSSTGKTLFDVLFLRCGQRLRCASIRFSARFADDAATPASVRAWNRNRHVGHAMLDRNGIAWLSMNCDAIDGAGADTLNADVRRWTEAMREFDVFTAS